MKRHILIAAAVVFCFVGCETVQDTQPPTDPPVFEETEIPEPVEIPNELGNREAELDRLEQELNAELANLRIREQELEAEFSKMDSLFTELEKREKIAEMEIARATQLRKTGGWMVFIGILLIVLGLYLLFKPRNKKDKEKPQHKQNDLKSSPQAEPEKPQGENKTAAEPKAPEPTSESTEAEEQDELYEQAKKLVVDNNKAAISFLQSELKIGRARVMKLLEELEEQGIVGPAESGKSRKVL